jgi:hypothetical protein
MILPDLLSIFQKKKVIAHTKETFAQSYSAFVPIGGSAELLSITVPTKTKFRFLSFRNSTATFSAWGTIFWDFLLNGNPLFPYYHIFDQIQDIQPLEIFGGSTLKIMAYNPTAAICKMGIALTYELEYQE